MHGISCKGRLLGGNGETIEFHYEAKGDAFGTVMIDSQKFELKKGSLFLVKTDGESVHVRQLYRELKNLQFDKVNLQSYARQDAEFQEFFGSYF